MAVIVSVDSAINYGKMMRLDEPFCGCGMWAVSIDDMFIVKGFHEVFTNYYGHEEFVPTAQYFRGVFADNVTNMILFRRSEAEGITSTDLQIIDKVAQACTVLDISLMDYIVFSSSPRSKEMKITSARMERIALGYLKPNQVQK